jgi:hypothetical protein
MVVGGLSHASLQTRNLKPEDKKKVNSRIDDAMNQGRLSDLTTEIVQDALAEIGPSGRGLSRKRPRFPGVARARDGYSAVARRHGMASRRRRLASSYFDRSLRILRRSSRRCAFCRDSSRR